MTKSKSKDINIEVKDGLVFIEAQDIGWHNAGAIADVKLNWPGVASKIDQIISE